MQIYQCIQLNAVRLSSALRKTSCHKHFFVVSRHQQTSPLATSDKCHNLPWSCGAVLITTTRSQCRQHAMKLDIGSESRFLHTPLAFGSRQNIAIRFGTQKLQWLCYPVVKKVWGYDYILTESTNVTDGRTHRQTDRQTLHDGIGRTYA